MIPGSTAELRRGISIPRESGDDPLLRQDILERVQYSPRERG